MTRGTPQVLWSTSRNGVCSTPENMLLQRIQLSQAALPTSSMPFCLTGRFRPVGSIPGLADLPRQ
jgi:hypothetical protein